MKRSKLTRKLKSLKKEVAAMASAMAKLNDEVLSLKENFLEWKEALDNETIEDPWSGGGRQSLDGDIQSGQENQSGEPDLGVKADNGDEDAQEELHQFSDLLGVNIDDCVTWAEAYALIQGAPGFCKVSATINGTMLLQSEGVRAAAEAIGPGSSVSDSGGLGGTDPV